MKDGRNWAAATPANVQRPPAASRVNNSPIKDLIGSFINAILGSGRALGRGDEKKPSAGGETN